MDGHGSDKEQQLIGVEIVGVYIILPANQLMDVGNDPIHQTDAPRPGKNTEEGYEQTAVFLPLYGWENKPQNCRGKHHPRREGKDNITDSMGHFFAGKPQYGTQDRGASHTQSRQAYKHHRVHPFQKEI